MGDNKQLWCYAMMHMKNWLRILEGKNNTLATDAIKIYLFYKISFLIVLLDQLSAYLFPLKKQNAQFWHDTQFNNLTPTLIKENNNFL